jgi:hypothetical protein
VLSESTFHVEQTITDPEGHNDWVLIVDGEWISGGKPRLSYLRLGPI